LLSIKTWSSPTYSDSRSTHTSLQQHHPSLPLLTPKMPLITELSWLPFKPGTESSAAATALKDLGPQLASQPGLEGHWRGAPLERPNSLEFVNGPSPSPHYRRGTDTLSQSGPRNKPTKPPSPPPCTPKPRPSSNNSLTPPTRSSSRTTTPFPLTSPLPTSLSRRSYSCRRSSCRLTSTGRRLRRRSRMCWRRCMQIRLRGS